MFATEPQTQTEDQPETLAEIVREVTDNGRTIINFLHDVMLNRVEDAKMCHRIAAARELAKLGSKEAEEFLKAVSRSENGRAPARASGKSPRNDELADIIKQETSGGRDIVRFLVDAMHGKLDGFKPCHRISAAKELLRIGFYNVPVGTDDEDDEDDDPISQAQLENQTRHNAKQYNDDDDPFDFDHYDQEDYIRDRAGERAEVHIFGGEEAREVACDASRNYWNEKSAGAHIADYDYSPIKNPEDDPYGKGCYGYKVLRIAFQDNNAIRVANKAVAEYHRRKFKYFINEDGSLAALADTESLDPHTLQYLERSRHLLANDDDKPPDDPDPPSSITPERAQNPPVGAGFKPAGEFEPAEPPENPYPGESRSHKLSDAKDPPRKRSAIIFTGPPDENDRLVRDPGGFQAAVDNVLSSGPL